MHYNNGFLHGAKKACTVQKLPQFLIFQTGSGAGVGFTINIPWCGEMMGDAEYLAAWRCIVEPVLRQFDPAAVVVSCGFDAAEGHWNAVGKENLHIDGDFWDRFDL